MVNRFSLLKVSRVNVFKTIFPFAKVTDLLIITVSDKNNGDNNSYQFGLLTIYQRCVKGFTGIDSFKHSSIGIVAPSFW